MQNMAALETLVVPIYTLETFPTMNYVRITFDEF